MHPTTASSGRQRLKEAVSLIEHYLADINLIFDKELLALVGQDGTQYVEFSWLQERIPLLTDMNANQMRRAIKYDSKDILEDSSPPNTCP
ncbi:hypothetical protein BGZ83_008445 [Gryganskiella cystojenkinii]|nr:hypothetical protein BGZ83_008445 [Gryganskiella cystojenkinii]